MCNGKWHISKTGGYVIVNTTDGQSELQFCRNQNGAAYSSKTHDYEKVSECSVCITMTADAGLLLHHSPLGLRL